ncbi:unnamed protein product [Clonostachys solani]|uniref:Major facilitator superfamily (MFS) profile domain-containing protein n=1 Tax=Clonostachys solani TaxID=160281 RepID=A0A9N9ZLR9_9HYPO|nr:unnamed protein product [Clonostachys solani]
MADSRQHIAGVEDSELSIVRFEGPDDLHNPRNWPTSRKLLYTILCGLTTMGATWSSAIYSTAVKEVALEFRVERDVANLGTSLFLMGFGVGPLLWSPLMARFLAGFFGSSPISVTGGILADLFEAQYRGPALVTYAAAVVGGPVFAPIAGSAMMQSGLNWRWTQYVTAIYMAVVLTLDGLFLHETFSSTILIEKARKRRFETNDWALHSKHEERCPDVKEMADKFLKKPFQLLATPICFAFVLHSSFVYAIVYINLGLFPIMFHDVRGWSQVVSSLPFLALMVGITFGGVFNLQAQKFYLGKLAANGGRAVPESRLLPMMAGSVLLTAGLFIMGNTSSTHYPWIAPAIAAVMMGFSFFTIFQSALSYLVDTFPQHAASAVAANTFLRSMLASIFPPIVSRIYSRVGVVWATNMLGFVALSMVPIPWIFYYFGKAIREKGTWSRASC